jgi:cytoskeletal protein RodZ
MATLGQQLKKSREDKGISMHEIAESTHIGVRFLDAIENDVYDILPGGVFNRAFVRKFAREVGFDEEQAVKLYEEQLEEQGGEPERRYQLGVEDFETKPTSGNGLLLSFVALVILGALAYAAYQYFTPPVTSSGGAPIAETTTPTPTPAGAATPAQGASPGASASPSASPTASPSATPEASPTPEGASAGPMRVQLVAPSEDVWVSVRPDGGKAQQMILKAGDTREFDVNEKLVLSIGRAPSLRIVVNGRTVDNAKLLPNLKGIIATNVVITKDNYQQFLN